MEGGRGGEAGCGAAEEDQKVLASRPFVQKLRGVKGREGQHSDSTSDAQSAAGTLAAGN
jgi:hypothetical protein